MSRPYRNGVVRYYTAKKREDVCFCKDYVGHPLAKLRYD